MALPTLTAFGIDAAYNMLYSFAPSIAQTFKPIQKSCEDNGIKMTVLSAEKHDSKTSVYLSMQDVTGSCPDGEWDLYDSYRINVPRDMIGNCSFSEYDSDTNTAYFVVTLETMDGSKMPNGKVTFSVREIMMGKVKSSGCINQIDLQTVPYEPETTVRNDISGNSYYDYDKEPDPKDYRFLIKLEQSLYSPVTGISVIGIGYVDGALHILTEYADNLHTDNHGYLYLMNNNKENFFSKKTISFFYWDKDHKNRYTEQIIPIDYESLSEYTL